MRGEARRSRRASGPTPPAPFPFLPGRERATRRARGAPPARRPALPRNATPRARDCATVAAAAAMPTSAPSQTFADLFDALNKCYEAGVSDEPFCWGWHSFVGFAVYWCDSARWRPARLAAAAGPGAACRGRALAPTVSCAQHCARGASSARDGLATLLTPPNTSPRPFPRGLCRYVHAQRGRSGAHWQLLPHGPPVEHHACGVRLDLGGCCWLRCAHVHHGRALTVLGGSPQLQLLEEGACGASAVALRKGEPCQACCGAPRGRNSNVPSPAPGDTAPSTLPPCRAATRRARRTTAGPCCARTPSSSTRSHGTRSTCFSSPAISTFCSSSLHAPRTSPTRARTSRSTGRMPWPSCSWWALWRLKRSLTSSSGTTRRPRYAGALAEAPPRQARARRRRELTPADPRGRTCCLNARPRAPLRAPPVRSQAQVSAARREWRLRARLQHGRALQVLAPPQLLR